MTAHVIVSNGGEVIAEFDTETWQRDGRFMRDALKREASALPEPLRSAEIRRAQLAAYDRVVVIENGECVLDRDTRSRAYAPRGGASFHRPFGGR